MRITYLLFLGSLLLLTSVQKEEADPPNIIFIMADDLGYADLGCYGQQSIQTPRIDALATEGMRFTQCYAGSTVCAPSRSVLITGQHTGHTTVRGNMGIGGVVGLGGAAGRIPLQEQDTTIAELLQTAGYTTGMIGKWGLGEPATTGMPDQQGFDYFYGFLNQRRAHTYFPDYVWRNDQRVDLPANEGAQHKDYIQNHFLSESLDFIERHQKDPFFLYLPYSLPHDEFEIDDQGRFADSTHWTEPERIYAAMVERLDRDVGLVLDQLDKYGLAENTMVFFCSDNGAAERWDGRFDSSGSLRGRKRDLYEGGIRVPMIVRFPGQIAAGSSSDLPWTFADVLPTLCATAGIEPPVNIDGSNLWGHFTGQADTVHTYGWYLQQYVRDTKAKGAIPIVCSMVPRNRWVDGTIERTADSYGGWAAQVAREEQTYFIDLNENVAAIYDTIGEEQLWKQYFKGDHTHTTCYGAELNAKSVALGLRELPYCPLATYLNLPE